MEIKYQQIRVEVDSTKTVLENLEAKKFNLDYQCREGYCGCCRMKLVSGEVSYITEPLGYMEEGDILPCCCKAVTDIEVSDL